MLLFVVVALCFVPWALVDGDEVLTPVTISIQPTYWALPYYIAQELGYFEELRLDASTKVYPSGAPQVQDAIENAAWDIGPAGVVPNIIGGKQGILTIGISDDESATNMLVGTGEGAAAWPLDSVADISIAVTPNSTGQFVVEACLEAIAVDVKNVNFRYEQQDEIIKVMNPPNGSEPLVNYGGLWTPFAYTFLDGSEGAEILCTGADVNATVTSGLMVREAFSDENPDVVNKVLSAWLRGIAFINNEANRDAVLQYLSDFFTSMGTYISQSSMEKQLELNTLFGLDAQLFHMDRSFDPSNPQSIYDFWTVQVDDFLLENGVVSEPPDPSTYITDKFMQNINNDMDLRAFALGEELSTPSTSESAPCQHLLFAGVIGVLVTAIMCVM